MRARWKKANCSGSKKEVHQVLAVLVVMGLTRAGLLVVVMRVVDQECLAAQHEQVAPIRPAEQLLVEHQ